jgi:two-component system, NtrC family, sensor kinase
MIATGPSSEKQRLKVLWHYEVLDTMPEELFDDLTELAARICEAPIALISLVDEDRQWFKSKVGVSLQETSRDVSFCAHAIRQEGLFIVPDTTKDDRFARNPLVTSDPKIRFYAGAPLVTPDGHALGTLCVIDKIPRRLRPEQEQALRVLARHVMTQLELRRHTRELADASQARQSADDELARVRAELRDLKRVLARTAAKVKACAPRSAKRRTARK